MTSHQIALVKESFEKIRPAAQSAGELFYLNLFEMAPQARALFKTPIPEQAGKLMYTLSYVVNHLHTPETIMDDVRRLAIKHHNYGASPGHYEIVGMALLKTLSQGLADIWDNELEEAWKAAYAMVANAMMSASLEHEKLAA
jgi:hemoglobin-like flavoprotein